jgi:hypothetical protein
MSSEDIRLINELVNSLQHVVYEQEPTISNTLRTVLKNSWQYNVNDWSSVTGEKEEAMSIKFGSDKMVFLIIEVCVDNNFGEKKTGQAFEYASLINSVNETVILLTLHFSLRQNNMKITQEAFIYKHSIEEDKRKLGFLWREVEESSDNCIFLEKSCGGIVLV